MPTELLSPGMPWTLVTNRVYALPAVKTTLFCSDTATFEQSNDPTFTAKQAVTLTGGSGTLTGMYLRAATGTPTVVLRRD